MAALKEIKARIASVQSTLKITSAMKMIASAKLHRVQTASASLAEYEQRLSDIASAIEASLQGRCSTPLTTPHEQHERATLVVIASDSSLCGSFNTNVYKLFVKHTEQLQQQGYTSIRVIPIGEKMVQAIAKSGYETDLRYRTLVGHCTYGEAARLAESLTNDYQAGRTDCIELVYSHFHSMSRQVPFVKRFLPLAQESSEEQLTVDYICEPKAELLFEEMLPQLLRTKLYAALLDSQTAEHAARTIAMQTASDNAQELLEELNLTYNKRRQQAITDELSDITSANL